jgi:hypothetical protein
VKIPAQFAVKATRMNPTTDTPHPLTGNVSLGRPAAASDAEDFARCAAALVEEFAELAEIGKDSCDTA